MSSLDDRGRAPRRPVAKLHGFRRVLALGLAGLLLGGILLLLIAIGTTVIDGTNPL